MSTIEKLKSKFFGKPARNDIRIDEVERLAAAYGCIFSSGGRHSRVVDIESGTVIPIPIHGDCVGEAYIKQLQILFASIEERNKGGDSE